MRITGAGAWLVITSLLASGCGAPRSTTESSTPEPPGSVTGNSDQSKQAEAADSSVESPWDEFDPLKGPVEISLPQVPEAQTFDVLSDDESFAEQDDDGNLRRRWQVRLYVNYNRNLPMSQQQPGSWVNHGKYEEFYPGGEQSLVAGAYKVGRRDGEWTYWHKNGTVAKQGRYNDGKLVGAWRYFTPEGKPLREEQYGPTN